jgi:hypothetical protein
VTRELPADVTVDNTDSLRRVAASSYNRARAINLRFMRRAPDSEHYVVHAWGSAFPEDGGGSYVGMLGPSHRDLQNSVDVLRQIWQDKVIENHYQDKVRGRRCHPFADRWDLSAPNDKNRFTDVGLTLANAGHNTFRMLFHGGDTGLNTIRGFLLKALACGETVISIESDGLVVPWGMLYTDTNGNIPTSNTWTVAGFWGYQHVIEHTFTRVEGFDSRITVMRDHVVVGLNVDQDIDDQYPKALYIASLIDFFTPRVNMVLRQTKDDLATAFQDPQFADHIMCFGCHGTVTGDSGVELPHLRLTDQEKIYGTDIMAWLAGTPLATRPFVFLGTCQGGQVTSTFYSGFGKALLDNGARCLVGPQVDLPPAFASEYSRRLFTAFLKPGTKLGDIVRSLAREFINDHANPLGLMFSLYRGIDVHLWWDEP